MPIKIIPFLRFLAALCISEPVYAQTGKFCQNVPRAEFEAFEKQSVSNQWFDVHKLMPNIFSISEPYQWQGVISYLIVGTNSAVLFDTGNGIGDIKKIISQITDKPVTVINSHGHMDHVGGNFQFENIVSVATDFTRESSRGLPNAAVHGEVSPPALCRSLPAGTSPETHMIKPFAIGTVVESGFTLDIGGRVLELLQVPGHTSDSLVMIDRAAGFMWTGDTYYKGRIWLYAPTTNMQAYRQTIHKLAALAPELTLLFPAHNVPTADPKELIKVRDGFEKVITGTHKPDVVRNGQVSYVFPTFSFLMREGHPILP